MNLIKERTAKTKGIATLFLSSSVLVGLMAMGGLSFPQSVSAQTIPGGCPTGTVGFEPPNCIGPAPTLSCAEEGQKVKGNEGKERCVGGGQAPNTPLKTCQSPFNLVDNQCVAKPGKPPK